MKQLVIDRFEGNYAVCEDGDSHISIEIDKLPIGAKEGSVLGVDAFGKYYIDSSDTELRRKRILEKQNRIFNKNTGMEFRLATAEDLPQLISVFTEIVKNMNDIGIDIWDEVYPCEFFAEDIKNRALYLLTEKNIIVSAFALCADNLGENAVEWQESSAKALYLDRFGVNVNYAKRGIGSLMLEKAKKTAKKLGADYLRLFVVDINTPAINLYIKCGFKRAVGVFDEVIDEALTLHEYGFEAAL